MTSKIQMDKFKDKQNLENNVKEIDKQIDFIKKVDETFKQDMEETTKISYWYCR